MAFCRHGGDRRRGGAQPRWRTRSHGVSERRGGVSQRRDGKRSAFGPRVGNLGSSEGEGGVGTDLRRRAGSQRTCWTFLVPARWWPMSGHLMAVDRSTTRRAARPRGTGGSTTLGAEGGDQPWVGGGPGLLISPPPPDPCGVPASTGPRRPRSPAGYTPPGSTPPPPADAPPKGGGPKEQEEIFRASGAHLRIPGCHDRNGSDAQ